jgi:hypothetical protein
MLVSSRHETKALAQAQGCTAVFPSASRSDLIRVGNSKAAMSSSSQVAHANTQNPAEVVIWMNLGSSTARIGTASPSIPALVVAQLLDLDPGTISEATVRQPPRSRRWVAIFTGEDGSQVARSTGMTDRALALKLARRWEREARIKRMRRARPPIPLRNAGVMTQAQVAALLRISERAVRDIEKRAIRKLRSHPVLRQIWSEFSTHHPDLEESVLLTSMEANALLALAYTAVEIEALRSVFRIFGMR